MATYCSIETRKRVTGWTNVSGLVWSAPFSLGDVTLPYINYGDAAAKATDGTLSDGTWFHDGQTLYFLSVFNPDSSNVSNFFFPGVTAEFTIYLSDKDYTYQSIPNDSASQVVDWIGGLVDVPQVGNGSTETLYGITPLNIGALRFLDGEGDLLPLLYDCSFSFALTKAWVDSKQVFLGYVNGFSINSENEINFRVSDYMSFFDREYEIANDQFFNTADFPSLDPKASSGNWIKRLVFGMVDGHECVNVDYSATPSVTNNRDWVSHYYNSGDTVGTVSHPVDHLAANGSSITYFTTTPQFNVGDHLELFNNGVYYRAIVISVNRPAKSVVHTAVGARTFTASDTGTRYFIGRVLVFDGTAAWYLRPGQDFTVFTDGTNKVAGFQMADDWETAVGFTDGIFDPVKHKLFVRVYGDKDLDQYDDATTVSALADEGGVRSKAISLLFRTVTDSGFLKSDIATDLWKDVDAYSHSFGFSIPEKASDTKAQTYKYVIESILKSSIWAMGFYESLNTIKLGIFAHRPFLSAGDYEADDTDLNGFSFDIDYADVYSNFILHYFKKETSIGETNPLSHETVDYVEIKISSPVANSLHLVSKTYSTDSLHFDDAEAAIYVQRLAYALGDRRGIYKINLGQEFLDSTALGVSYNLIRERLPGFEYERRTYRTRQTTLIEVQKSTDGVSISLDDQKGIQDNSGNW